MQKNINSISNFDLSRCSPRRSRSVIKVFARLFQKAALIQRAERWSPSADGEIPNRSKAPPKGECQAKGLAEGGPLVGVLRLGEVMNRTSGGVPFLHKGYLNSISAFFFGTTGAKKKAWQKRRRRKIISRLARRDQRSARWISGRFLKKAT